MTKQYYDTRSRGNIAKLADNTKAAALKLYEYCVANDIHILIYETIRTKEQQAINIKNGVSQTMLSYHIVGQALDFVPADKNGKVNWSGYNRADIKQMIKYAKSLGFEWGGDWRSFPDAPHLQFNFKGYGTDTFGKKPITTVSKPTTPSPSTSETLVGYLNSKKIDSSFSNREKLAKQYGIKNYTGTADQNTKLLDLLKKGASSTPSKSPSTTNKNEYFTTNPGKVKLLTTCNLYTSVEFSNATKSGLSYPKGTEFTVKEIKKSKAGTPRLIVSNGKYVLTANKDNVKKI